MRRSGFCALFVCALMWGSEGQAADFFRALLGMSDADASQGSLQSAKSPEELLREAEECEDRGHDSTSMDQRMRAAGFTPVWVKLPGSSLQASATEREARVMRIEDVRRSLLLSACKEYQAKEAAFLEATEVHGIRSEEAKNAQANFNIAVRRLQRNQVGYLASLQFLQVLGWSHGEYQDETEAMHCGRDSGHSAPFLKYGR